MSAVPLRQGNATDQCIKTMQVWVSDEYTCNGHHRREGRKTKSHNNNNIGDRNERRSAGATAKWVCLEPKSITVSDMSEQMQVLTMDACKNEELIRCNFGEMKKKVKFVKVCFVSNYGFEYMSGYRFANVYEVKLFGCLA